MRKYISGNVLNDKMAGLNIYLDFYLNTLKPFKTTLKTIPC